MRNSSPIQFAFVKPTSLFALNCNLPCILLSLLIIQNNYYNITLALRCAWCESYPNIFEWLCILPNFSVSNINVLKCCLQFILDIFVLNWLYLIIKISMCHAMNTVFLPNYIKLKQPFLTLFMKTLGVFMQSHLL